MQTHDGCRVRQIKNAVNILPNATEAKNHKRAWPRRVRSVGKIAKEEVARPLVEMSSEYLSRRLQQPLLRIAALSQIIAFRVGRHLRRS